MSEFVQFLHEVFIDFGELSSRRMFGGHGIYHHGLMIALVADDELYLKADSFTKNEFLAAGSPPFEYDKNGKTGKMSYYLAPEEIFDDPELADTWARLAFEAAVRNANSK